MVPLVGGPAYADNLVPLLEKLAREEETVVRDAAVQSLSNVAASFTTDQALEHLVPCVRVRSLHCRSSCTCIYDLVQSSMGTVQGQLKVY